MLTIRTLLRRQLADRQGEFGNPGIGRLDPPLWREVGLGARLRPRTGGDDEHEIVAVLALGIAPEAEIGSEPLVFEITKAADRRQRVLKIAPPRLPHQGFEYLHMTDVQPPFGIRRGADEPSPDLHDVAAGVALDPQEHRVQRPNVVLLVYALEIAFVAGAAHRGRAPFACLDTRITKRLANGRPGDPPHAQELSRDFGFRGFDQANGDVDRLRRRWRGRRGRLDNHGRLWRLIEDLNSDIAKEAFEPLRIAKKQRRGREARQDEEEYRPDGPADIVPQRHPYLFL